MAKRSIDSSGYSVTGHNLVNRLQPILVTWNENVPFLLSLMFLVSSMALNHSSAIGCKSCNRIRMYKYLTLKM